jgi:hypothetical protein
MSVPFGISLTSRLGGGVFHKGRLESAVESGHVSLNRLNEMVARILAPFYRLGQDTVRLYLSIRIIVYSELCIIEFPSSEF